MTAEFCRSNQCVFSGICVEAQAIRKINPSLGTKIEVVEQIRYAKEKALQRGCPNEAEINMQAGKVIQAIRRAGPHR